MVIAAEPVARGAGALLDGGGGGGGVLSTTELLNPRRRFVHSDRATCDVRDIAGAQPRKLVSTLGARSLDPLDPVYALPSCALRPATPPKFVKCSLDTRDIWGAQPAIPQHQLIKTRDHIDYSDIRGSRSRPLVRTRSLASHVDTLDVFDINRGEYKTFRSRRVTDPLSPRYDYDSAHCSSLAKEYSKAIGSVKTEMGDIPGSHAAGPVHARQKDLQLYTADIMGDHRTQPPRRDPPRHPCDIRDIAGAQAGTVKYKPNTRRHTNPLQPAYHFLDYQSRRRSQSSQQRGSKGTFAFDLAPSADLTPADPSFAGTALHHGVRSYRAKNGRRGAGSAKGLHLSHARGTLRAAAARGSSSKLPPMNGELGSGKWTGRSSAPSDQRAAMMPAFHRANAKTLARKASKRAAASGGATAAAHTTTQYTVYQQRRRAERRAEDIERVRELN